MLAATGEGPLPNIVAADDVAATWESLRLLTKREVIDTLMTITILPAGKGVKFDPIRCGSSGVIVADDSLIDPRRALRLRLKCHPCAQDGKSRTLVQLEYDPYVIGQDQYVVREWRESVKDVPHGSGSTRVVRARPRWIGGAE